MMDKFDVLDVNRIQSERIAELEARIKELHETIAGQLATITALTVGTDGSTPAIVQISRLEVRIAELEAKRVPEGWSVRPVAEADGDVKGFVIGTPRTADGVRHYTSIYSDTDDPAEQLLYALLAAAPEVRE